MKIILKILMILHLQNKYSDIDYYNEYDNNHTSYNSSFPSLKEFSRGALDSNEKWKILFTNLKYQLSRIQGVKDAMERRNSLIMKYRSNCLIILKKKVKQEK